MTIVQTGGIATTLFQQTLIRATEKRTLYPSWLFQGPSEPVHSICSMTPSDETKLCWIAQETVYLYMSITPRVRIEGGYLVELHLHKLHQVKRWETGGYAAVLDPEKWIAIALKQIIPAEQQVIYVHSNITPTGTSGCDWELEPPTISVLKLS